MGFTTSNFKVVLYVFILLTLGIALMNCSSSEYICFKVKKLELMPDIYELSRDSLIVGGFKIGKMAQRYYNKPVSMAGGGESFTRFIIPSYLQATEYGTYIEYSVTPSVITLICTGKQIGQDGSNPIQVTCTITPESILTMIDN
jgi:hypothetical protein